MRRITAILTAVVAAVLLTASPALAAVSSTPGAPVHLAPRALVPPCVTTTWRAHYWHMDKTRPFTICYKADRETWIPKAWTRIGYVVNARGERRPVYVAGSLLYY